MKILLVNKYLYRKGGAETYFIKLGEYLKSLGNEVEYFGMADERNCVGNRVEAYTESILLTLLKLFIRLMQENKSARC